MHDSDFRPQAQNPGADEFQEIVDHGLKGSPSYDELYRRWERQPWSVHDLDFSADRRQWLAAGEAQRAEWLQLGRFAGFQFGEAWATAVAAAYLQALPRAEQRLYLATQAADEARHVVFFARFLREVLDRKPEEGDGTPSNMKASPGLRDLFAGALAASAAALRAHPSDETVMVEAVTVSHVVLEGAIGLSMMRTVLRDFKKVEAFPGLRAGLALLARDECRHVHFGLRFLQDLVRKDPAHAEVIARCVGRLLPSVCQVLEPPPERAARMTALGLDPTERRGHALGLLRRHLQTIGVRVPLPGAGGLAPAA